MSGRNFKLVLLGNAGVGKSCLVLRFVREEFFEDQETTVSLNGQNSCVAPCQLTFPAPQIGAAFLVKNLLLEEGPVKLEIWDTAGQERYRSLAPMYYRGAAAAVIVFDLTNADSLDGAKTWVKELQKKGDPNMVLAIVGNKADLVAKRKVSSESAREYATSVGALYMESSAKHGEGVLETFKEISRAVLPKLKQNNVAVQEAKKGVVELKPSKPVAETKQSACC